MIPERPRWLARWLQADDDELLYVDQTLVRHPHPHPGELTDLTQAWQRARHEVEWQAFEEAHPPEEPEEREEYL